MIGPGITLWQGQLQSTLAVSLQNGLAAYWALEEASGTRFDSSGNGNHLTSNNSVGQAAGIIGNAASFVAASSQYLSIANKPSLQFASSFTIAGWVKPTSVVGTAGVVGKFLNGTNLEWLLLQSNSILQMYISSDGMGGTLKSVSSVSPISAGAWSFVAAWYDGLAQTLNISVNQEAPVALAGVSPAFAGNSPICVGVDQSDTVYFGGSIDEMVLWKRVLTAAERAYLYNAGAGKTWPFT